MLSSNHVFSLILLVSVCLVIFVFTRNSQYGEDEDMVNEKLTDYVTTIKEHDQENLFNDEDGADQEVNPNETVSSFSSSADLSPYVGQESSL